MTPVAVLFARSDSVYKTLAGCDVNDMERDARLYRGPYASVCHPQHTKNTEKTLKKR